MTAEVPNHPRLTKRVLIVFAIASLVIVGVVYGVICWSLPHGFDWTDEAWAVSLTTSDRITVDESWGFQYLLHPLFDAVGRSVIAFRVFRLVGYLLLSLYYVAVFRRIAAGFGLKLGLASWLIILSVSQVATFFPWSYTPRALNYNELASWLAQLGAGALLVVIAGRLAKRPLVGRSIALLLWGGLGAVTVLLVAAKFTTGILFGVIVVFALLIADPAASALRRVLAVLVGMVGAVAVMLLAGFPFASYLSALESLAFNARVRAANAHPIGQLLRLYVHDLHGSLAAIALSLVLVLVIVGLLVILANRVTSPAVRILLVVVVCLAGVALGWSIVAWSERQIQFIAIGYFAIFLGVIATLAVLAAVVVGARRGRLPGGRSRGVAGFGALIVAATPFICAIGTNNPLSGELLFSTTIWASALGLVLVAGTEWLLRRGALTGLVPAVLALFLIAVSAVGVGREVFISPYRNPPYQDQNSPTKAPALAGVDLSAPAARWANWMHRESAVLGAGQSPTISLISPGALLVFNNSPYTDPWITTSSQIQLTSITTSCSTQSSRGLIILEPKASPKNAALFRQVGAALRKCGIAFPQDFEMVARYQGRGSAFDTVILRLKRS